MSLPNELHPLQLGAGSAAAYEIEQSLRFNSADSAYLTRTVSTNGNGRTFTISLWFKKGGKGGVRHAFYGAGDTANPSVGGFWFRVDIQERLWAEGGGGTTISVSSADLFRDHSAWYHFVCAVDTTQSTSSNRVKLYVNGQQISSFNSTSYPSQNYQFDVNLTNASQQIGRANDANTFAYYVDGYVAEYHLLDGTQASASDFGEYNNNGVWVPKEYIGSYGTNGFYLTFDPTATNGIGHDHSGNGNNWTPTGFDTTTYDSDVVTDTPTKNFATLNPLIGRDPGGLQKPSYSNGNLQMTSGLDPYNNGRIDSTTLIRPVAAGGTFKYEFKLLSQLNHAVGWMAWDPENFANEVGSNAPAWVSSRTSPSGGGTATAYTSSGTVAQSDYTDVAINDIVTVTIDLDNSTASWYVNGTRKGHITGCNFSDYEYITIYMREATRTQTSATMNCNFGQKAFQYTGVSGDAWGDISTLPAPNIADGSDYFQTVLYTGNNTTNSITVADNSGNSWGPDFVWIKPRNFADHHRLNDKVRGVNKTLSSNLTNAEYGPSNAYLDSFDSGGFTISSSDAGWNSSSYTYVAWNWKAGGSGSSNTAGSITSTVSANASAGFSIVGYEGNNTAGATVGHGLGVSPSMIIIKNRDNSAGRWIVYHRVLGGTKYIRLDGGGLPQTDSSVFNDTAPSSTTFTLGTNYYVNGNTENIIAYCFAEVEGYSKFGSYQGNGNADGPFIHLGFKPAWLVIKNTTTEQGWYLNDSARNPYNLNYLALFPASSGAESNSTGGAAYDFLSNGFKPRTSNNDSNGSGDTYIYMAFAEHPFGGDGVSPATAR